jgi:hypothetical protein
VAPTGKRSRPYLVTSAGEAQAAAGEIRRSQAACPAHQGVAGSPPAGSPAPRVSPELGFSGRPESVEGSSLAAVCCAGRAQEKRLFLGSGRAGRSSPYRFALMIFLKERDSCEQTGLTETGFHPHPPGDFFLSAPDFKVSNRPCQRRDKEDLGCLLRRVMAAHLCELSAGRRARKVKLRQTLRGPRLGPGPGGEAGHEGSQRRAVERNVLSLIRGFRSREPLWATCALCAGKRVRSPGSGCPGFFPLQVHPSFLELLSESSGPGANWTSGFRFLASAATRGLRLSNLSFTLFQSNFTWSRRGTLVGRCTRGSSSRWDALCAQDAPPRGSAGRHQTPVSLS